MTLSPSNVKIWGRKPDWIFWSPAKAQPKLRLGQAGPGLARPIYKHVNSALLWPLHWWASLLFPLSVDTTNDNVFHKAKNSLCLACLTTFVLTLSKAATVAELAIMKRTRIKMTNATRTHNVNAKKMSVRRYSAMVHSHDACSALLVNEKILWIRRPIHEWAAGSYIECFMNRVVRFMNWASLS